MVYILVNKENLIDIVRNATLKARQRCEKNYSKHLIKQNEKLVAENIYLNQIIDDKNEGIRNKNKSIDYNDKEIAKQRKTINRLENEIRDMKILFCDTILQKQNSDKDKTKEVDNFIEIIKSKEEIKSLKERAIYDLNENNRIWNEFVLPKVQKANMILDETHNAISRIKDRLNDNSKSIDYTFILAELQKLVSFGDKIIIDENPYIK